MKPNELKAQLALHGISQAHIGRQLGYTRAAVNLVVNGHWRCPRIENAIADALNATATHIFGPGPTSRPRKRFPANATDAQRNRKINAEC